MFNMRSVASSPQVGVIMFESFRAYQTTKAHEYGRGWCLHVIDENQNISVQKRWFKDLMSMFAFLIQYPEGDGGKLL